MAVMMKKRILLVCVLILAFAGCSRWAQVRPLPSPSPVSGPVTMSSARVTPSTTGMMVVLHRVEVTADSVTGWEDGRRVAYARDQVLLLERTETSPWTWVIVATLALALVGYLKLREAIRNTDF